MKLFENGVGRPSNETLKKRKIFIASVVIAVVALFAGCLALFSVNTERLTGATKNGNVYLNMSVKNWSVSSNGCYVTFPTDIKNTGNREIVIKSASIYYVGGNPMQTITVNRTLAADTKIRQNLTFDVRKLTSETETEFKITLWFTVAGKNHTYYKYDLYSDNGTVTKAIKNCKNTTTTKPTTTKKPSTNLKCSDSSNGYISCTTVAGATVEVLGHSPVSFMKNFKADSNGKITFAVPKEGTYDVQSIKSGYTSTKQTVTYKKGTTTTTTTQTTTVKKTTAKKTTVKKTTAKELELTLTCPESAEINETFFCYTNNVDVTISVESDNLKDGLNKSFKTTSKDKKKRVTITKAETINIVAKKGNSEKTATVKITEPEFEKLDLYCPSTVNKNEEFICYTSVTGAKISFSTKGFKSSKYASNYTTNNHKRWKDGVYTKSGVVSVKVSKSGYKTVTKKITVR